MANKKKKVGSHKSKLQQQYLADLNEHTVLALEAPSRTVHATVPPISNSNPSPPTGLISEIPRPNPHVPSASHGLQPQFHVAPSPNINHVFVDSDDDALDDEEVDYASSGDDYAGGSQFFTSSIFEAPSVPAASLIGAHSVPATSPACPFPDPGASPVASPACPFPDPVASPVRASSPPVAPAEVNVPLADTAHPPLPQPLVVATGVTFFLQINHLLSAQSYVIFPLITLPNRVPFLRKIFKLSLRSGIYALWVMSQEKALVIGP
jgi:hypothetical protein